jgi:hypothetical protein
MSSELEWQVLEEDELDGLPEERDEVTARSRPWRQWFVLLLVVVALAAALLWQQARERAEALRVELREAVHVEERVRYGGDRAQWAALLDPAAPVEWRYRYAFAHSRFYGDPPDLPDMRVLHLQEEGTLATVELFWPNAGATDSPTEQRAYRTVNGIWRRTPLAVADELVVEQRTENFVLSGPESVVQEITGELELLELLETMRAHIDQGILRARWFNGDPVHIVIRPRELMTFTVEGPLSQHRTMIATSPTFSKVDFYAPLSPESQYRLDLAEGVSYRLVPAVGIPPTELDGNYLIWHQLLRQAEVRQWVLTAEERRQLRNYWREQLAGAWIVPWEGSLVTTELSTTEDAQEVAQRRLVTALMLDYLREDGSPDVIMQVAERAGYTPPSRGMPFRNRLEPVLTHFDDFDDFERQLREYVLVME